ncbi:HNH endonuclease signature motif containing protein [Corynebacterium sp. AOP40-9SA-29]|uniref:HNH endonuclease signature motif containing protein n=1 Tax=Corynebacterium sp. AOP40-9SA-29 TaxID=3457677 RepID=UPI004034F603
MADTTAPPPPTSPYLGPPPPGRLPETVDYAPIRRVVLNVKDFPTRGFRSKLWAIETDDDPASVAVRAINRGMIELAVLCTPLPGSDVTAHHSRVQARLAVTRTRAETYTDIGLLCQRMPQLREVLERGFLSFDHLRLLARSADGIRHEDTAAAQDALIEVFSPRRQGQLVPGPRAMVKKILKALHQVDALARPIDPTDPEEPKQGSMGMIDQALNQPAVDAPAGVDARDCGTATRRVSVDTYDPCATVITATLPPEEAEEFMVVLDAVCRKMDCSRAAGLMHLARGTADVTVTLNVFREISSPIAATAGGHWLDAMATAKFMDRVTHLRIPGHEATESYVPTRRMVDFVTGVHSCCTYPGCEVPADRCDIDHVHRFDHDSADSADSAEQTGPTDTRNLHPLCRTHHLLKTMGWVDVTKGRDGALLWSSVDDGHVHVVEPSGPLAAFARTSFAERASRRFTTVREHNERRIAELAEVKATLEAARAEATEEVPF